MLSFNPRYNLFSREYWFGQVDTRPLSVFRIVFGLVLLKDALFHLPLAYWFYSDQGIAPRETINGIVREYRFSLMDAMPFTWMAQAFFLLWALVLICYTVGWRTRLMSVLNFLFLISIHERNIYVLNGADTVIRVVCFWTMFLPLSHYYSVDAMRERFARYLRTRDLADLRSESDTPPDAKQRHTTYAFPLRIAQIQFAMIYLFTGILKLPGFAWQDGTAIFYALQLKSLTLPTGDFLVSNAPLWMLRVMSYQSLITELVFFWFVFAPLGQPYLRIVALILGFMLHAGIGATMAIGNFSAVMISSYLLFFEPEWITWVGAKLRAVRTPSMLPVPAGPSPLWMLLAATTPREIEIDPDHMIAPGDHDEWWIADPATERLTGAAAWQRAMGHLPLSKLYTWATRFEVVRAAIWDVLCLISLRDVPPRPTRIGEATPDPDFDPAPLLPMWARSAAGVITGALSASLAFWAISNSRSTWSITEWNRETAWALIFMVMVALVTGFGAASAFDWLGNLRPMRDYSLRLLRAAGRSVFTAALMLLFSTILWWNFTTLRCGQLQSADLIGSMSRFWCDNDRIIDSVPEVPRRIVQQLSLWQAWDMFSPYPSTLDGWVVIPGRFEDGTTYDINTGEPVSTEFRRWFYGPGMRWKKYESNLSRDAPDDLLAAWGSYLCGYYNKELNLPRGQRLATLEIRFYQYRSHAPDEPPNEMQDVMLWKHWCYPEYEY